MPYAQGINRNTSFRKDSIIERVKLKSERNSTEIDKDLDFVMIQISKDKDANS
jgi:hypothetical protein